MKIFSLISLYLLMGVFTATFAQECVVITSPGFPEIPDSSYGDSNILGDFSPTQIKTVFVAAHIVRSNSGAGGISTADLNLAIAQLNSAYSDAMIEFVHDHTDYIDNDNYTTLSSSNFPELAQINVVANKLNIYFCPQGSGINGIAYVPGNKCAVTNAAAINGSTLAHEVGHNFYLYHTHGNGIQEYVNGSNCTSAGDFLCDTPAEPYNGGSGISGYVYTGNCAYFGTFRDPNNELYTPDTHNYLNYAPPSCREHFSTNQIQKMNQTLSSILSYLINASVPLANKTNGNLIPNIPVIQPSTLTVVGLITVNSGTPVVLSNGESYDIRTNQERFPNYLSYGNIKHNNWNDQTSEFKLTENYIVGGTGTHYRDANFLGLNYGKIEVLLEGQLMPGKGSAEFQDPWYVLSNGTQPGNYWKQFISSYEPTGKEGATEKGVFLNQGSPNWAPPYYSVGMPTEQTISVNGKNRKFYPFKWTGTIANFQYEYNRQTGVVFTGTNAVVEANLKGTQLSNDINAYNNNNQKKFVRSDNGVLHNVYISLDALWYERSTDGGTTWYIEGGNPLNTNNPKGVSIAHLPGSSGDDYVVVAYQCTSSTGSEVWIELFKNGVRPYGTGFRRKVVSFIHSPGEYNDMNAEPVVALNWGSTYKDFMVVFKVPGMLPENGDDPTIAGLYRCLGRLNPMIYYQMEWYNTDINIPAHALIPTTGINSLYPAFAGELVSQSNYFHLAYQENNQIKYYYMYGQTGTGSLSTGGNPYVCSNNTGFSQHYNPSIISMGTTARVCWVGYRMVYYEEENEVDAFPQYRVLFRRPGQTSFWQFGNNVSSPNINKNSTSTYYAFAWSENNSQIWFADNSLSTVRLLDDVTGQQVQVSNGTATTNMYCMIYEHSTGVPHYFERSNNLDSYYQSHKITNNFFSSGREGVVSVDSAEFYFALGDIEVDGQTINFIEIPDTLEVNNLNSINQCLITEPITLSNNSSFIYSVQYGLNDSLSAVQAITGERFINFKVKLVDNNTGEVIGEYDNVTYNSNSLYHYNNISYQINTQGIGNRTARLKLVLDNNFSSEFSLSRIFADEYVLNKTSIKQISYKGGEVIKSYELSQNYPNPFNPSTTIKFQIPSSGDVKLNVYDILGNEVAKLVDGYMETGKYEFSFDASSLASGVYIYRLNVNDYVSVKKMVLLK